MSIADLRNALVAGLAPLAQYRQFVLYTLRERPGNTAKLDKIPLNCKTLYEANAHSPDTWVTWEEACNTAEALGHPYGVGFAFTENDPFFFLDIDSCLMPSRDRWSEVALQLTGAFNGCYIEVSQSGEGLHIIGSYATMPPHGCKNTAFGLEFYHTARFVALTGDRAIGNAGGRAATEPVAWLINTYFMALADDIESGQEWTDFRIPPTEDESLIARMLNSKASARAAFGGKATVKQLWTADSSALSRAFPDAFQGRPYDCSSADAALAQHLAFWTRKDCERMRRLMWMSNLRREKWQREDYLPRTILKACAKQHDVLTVLPINAQPTPKTTEIKEHDGTSFLTPHDQRAWFGGCCYITSLNRILTEEGLLLDQQRFDIIYGGRSFGLDAANTKTAKGAWDAFTHSTALDFPKVDDICFRPELPFGSILEEHKGTLVNTYMPIETPCEKGDVTPWLEHMGKLFPDPVDRAIIDNYMAACVQFPGDKFQLWPVIQGVEGNGKTLLLSVLENAIGHRYCHRPKADELMKSGLKFNAWARGKILIGIEEIKIADRFDLWEVMKDFITNDRLEIQGKGQDQGMMDNRANGMLFTNHQDGVPKRRNDRRCAIFFTPQQQFEDLARDGMAGDYFPNLYTWLRNGGYARITYHLKTFVIDQALSPAIHNGGKMHRAPMTSSTARALEISRSRIEQMIWEAIENGEPGFASGWLSSQAVHGLIANMPGRPIISLHRVKEIIGGMDYTLHPALIKGRTNNVVLPDNKRTSLYVVKGHLALNITDPTRVARMYTAAQPTPFGAPQIEAVIAAV